jgi:thiamine-phosphate pyrophosphorylase
VSRLDPRSLSLYVITSAALVPGRDHRDVARAAIDGGATALQLRAPELDGDEVLPLARDLAASCARAGVLFLVNDRADVAVASGAGGAHVGQHDDLDGARARLGRDRVLGVSVNDREQALAARRAGADYLGVTVWPSPTKPEAVPIGLDGLAEIATASGLPVVGIGGIRAANLPDVLRAGAAGVAVVSAIAGAPDPRAATTELRAVVDRLRAERDET